MKNTDPNTWKWLDRPCKPLQHFGKELLSQTPELKKCLHHALSQAYCGIHEAVKQLECADPCGSLPAQNIP